MDLNCSKARYLELFLNTLLQRLKGMTFVYPYDFLCFKPKLSKTYFQIVLKDSGGVFIHIYKKREKLSIIQR